MGICAVRRKPHVATLPRPSLIRRNLLSVIGKSKDHQQIPPVGLKEIEWRDEVEKKDIAPFRITFGNGTTIVLDENGYKLCYNVVAFSFVAVQLFEFIWAAYPKAFEDPKPSADSPSQNSGADNIDVDKQVSSCAGYDPHVYGHKRQSTGGGGGGSEPKKHRSDNQGDGNNYNNAPPGDHGAGSGSGSGSGHAGHDDNGGGSDENCNTNPGNASPEKRFACPFHKMDPLLHAACEPLKLTSWDRVLQHIFRAHVLQQHYCPICRTQFKGKKAERERNAHHIQNQCQPASMMETGFIFPEIVPEKLYFETDYEHLKGLPRGSDEEKWFKAWEKLFPGRPRPASPLFESIVDVLRRRAHSVLARIPQPQRSRVVDAIFDLPTVGSQRPQDSTPLAPTPALTSNPAAMTPTQTMTPLDPALSPAPITALAPAPAPPSASISAPMRRPRAQPRVNPSSLPQVGYGQSPCGSIDPAMNAPARPHPPAPSVGYGPPRGSNQMTGRSIPALPDQVLLQSPVGQNPVSQQNLVGQQNSFNQSSNLDPLQTWPGPMQMFDNNSIWNLGNENIFANAEMGISPGGDENEDEDELNHLSGSGHQGPGSGFGSDYPDPGSGWYMG